MGVICNMVKKMLSIVTSLVLFFSITTISPAAETINNKIKYIDSYLQDLQSEYEFNGNVLIVRNGEILLNKSYGMADFSKKIKNTPDTKFLISSNTKAITATAIMQLAEKGKLKLTDTLNKYIPDYPRGKEITIKELLTHSSGIPDYLNDFEVNNIFYSNYTPTEIIKLFKNRPLKFKPGSQFSYSNSGYVLLGYIIEKVSGENYGNYIKENIFNKAGMSTACYVPLEKVNNLAIGTYLDFSKTPFAQPLPLHNYLMGYGDSGITCTTNDLYKFDMELIKTNSKLLSKKSITEMLTGQITVSDDIKYGYGLGIEPDGSIDHSGSDPGYKSFNAIIPKDKIVIIILENIENASTAVYSTIRSILAR